MAPYLEGILGKFDITRFWPRKVGKAVLSSGPIVVSAGNCPSTLEVRFYYDDGLNLVEREDAVYELYLYRELTFEWRLLRGTPDDRAQFSIMAYTSEWNFEQWTRFPSNVVVDLIPKLAREPGSSCSAAFQWIHLDWHGRFRLFLATHRASLDDCEKVLKWLAWTFTPNDQTPTRGSWRITINQSDDQLPNPTLWSHVKRDCVLLWDNEPHQMSDEQLKLLRIVYSYFRPFYFENARRHNGLIRRVWTGEGIQWQFDVLKPTQHERLEAHLELRDWLRTKVSPDELLSLLGEA